MYHQAEGGAKARIDIDPTDFGFKVKNYVGDQNMGFRLDWYKPNLSILYFDIIPGGRLLHVFCIPINEQRTRIMTARRVNSEDELAKSTQHAKNTDNRVITEDRVIVESQRGDVLSDPDELSVGTDEPTVIFRKWYKQQA
jgi:phenylpropionate dioxygenase-like ring-hydroxylating dioxygenase large terminal subunit